MKPVIFISLWIAVVAPQADGQSTPVVAMRDAATHDQLALTYRKAMQADPMAAFKPVKGEDPSVVNQPKNLVDNSDIVCFGGSATLVPKRAILNVPKALESRLKYLPGSKIQSWAGFYALNRGWITTVEVSRSQAEGKQPMDEKIAERVRNSTNLVVATYMGGPISVLPPKVKEATPTTQQKS